MSSLEPAVIPGLPAGPEVQFLGNEYQAQLYSSLDCDALLGWLQAGDWVVDGQFSVPEPSPTPANPDDVTPLRVYTLSRPGDAAAVRVGAISSGGCSGAITRLARQTMQASGATAASTEALAFPMSCAGGDPRVAAIAYLLFGDDGTLAYVQGKLNLALGEQQLSEVQLRIGQSDRRPSTSAELFLIPSAEWLDRWNTGLATYTVGDGATARATVTSIDPLIGTITLANLSSASGPTESLAVGMRCDLPRHALTDIANAVDATPTPSPTPPPGSHLEVQVGEIDERIDSDEVGCSYVAYEGITPRWQLTYYPSLEGEVSIQLTVPESGEPTLTVRRGDLLYAADGSQGSHLDATVDEREAEVDFTVDGADLDGNPVHLASQCRNISR